MMTPTIQILCHDGTPLKRESESIYACPTCGDIVVVAVA